MPRRDPSRRRAIEGRLVDDCPEPNHYVPQLSRGRRFVLWFLRSGAAEVVVCLALIVPVLMFGGWYFAFLAGLVLGALVGWFLARRHFKAFGDVPRL